MHGPEETALVVHLQVEDLDVLELHAADAVFFRDDLTWQLLDPTLVRAARQKGLEYLASKQVWADRPVAEPWKRMGVRPDALAVSPKTGSIGPQIRQNKISFFCFSGFLVFKCNYWVWWVLIIPKWLVNDS